MLEKEQGVAKRPERCEEVGSTQDTKQTWCEVLRERLGKDTVGWDLPWKLEAGERSGTFSVTGPFL